MGSYQQSEGMGINEIIQEEYVLWKDDGKLNSGEHQHLSVSRMIAAEEETKELLL